MPLSTHVRSAQPVHSGRADWLPANPERGISPPQSNGHAGAGTDIGLIQMEECPSLTLYMADAGNSVNSFQRPLLHGRLTHGRPSSTLPVGEIDVGRATA